MPPGVRTGQGFGTGIHTCWPQTVMRAGQPSLPPWRPRPPAPAGVARSHSHDHKDSEGALHSTHTSDAGSARARGLWFITRYAGVGRRRRHQNIRMLLFRAGVEKPWLLPATDLTGMATQQHRASRTAPPGKGSRKGSYRTHAHCGPAQQQQCDAHGVRQRSTSHMKDVQAHTGTRLRTRERSATGSVPPAAHCSVSTRAMPRVVGLGVFSDSALLSVFFGSRKARGVVCGS